MKAKLEYIPSVNFQIIGISSTEIDYKLAYNITKNFNIDFYMLEDIVVEKEQPAMLPQLNFGEASEPSRYSVYGNVIDSYRKSDLLLISNRGSGTYLLDEFHKFDYIFIVRDDGVLRSDDALKYLRSVACISGAYLLSLETIKTKKNIYLLWDSLQNRQ